MAIFLNYRIFLFAPWYVISALGINYRADEKYFLYFLNIFVAFQWIVMFAFSGLDLLGVVVSNLGILGFLVSNIYLQLSPSQYHGKSKEFLCSYFVRLTTGVGSLVYMYVFYFFR